MRTNTLQLKRAMRAALLFLLLIVAGMMNANAQDSHSYVDLGLPSGTLWATCNVGANAPEEYGDYFAWGETIPKDTYNWSNYQYCNGSNNTLIKYCNDSSYGYNGFTDTLTVLLPEDDVATTNWGIDWHMPTPADWVELYQNTTQTWTTQNGANGYLFTASNGDSLFLPATGWRLNSCLYSAGSYGGYWSSSLYTVAPYGAWKFSFASDDCSVNDGSRICGQSVRAVRSKSQNTVPTGAINGKFTINDNGDQMCFSQGNLQYQASTNTWCFAENQWDYVGEDNANISPTYDGLIDFFGWGTSGYHDLNDSYNVNYMPWASVAELVNPDYNMNGYGPSMNMPSPNLTESSANYDWGVYNAISNGGNQTNQWRTLTIQEWNFVFNTRTTTSGIRYAKAKVNNINGVILLPDDWSINTFSLNNTNESGASFTSNIISRSQWNNLENAGAVFLPASGYRGTTSVGPNITTVYESGSQGFYLSSSCFDSYQAHLVWFYDGCIDATGHSGRYVGHSVRLVCPAPAITSYSIEVIPNPTEGGTVTGSGTYVQGETCTVTATANDGYHFVNWTKDGTIVSTEANYSFTVIGDGDYIAHFDLVQATSFSQGWNWWSTYIEQDGTEGLSMLENGLGASGSIIKSQADGFVSYADGFGWAGTLTELHNEQSYRIQTDAACTVPLHGSLANPADHPVTLNPGWTWMGFPWNESVSIEAATEGFVPEANDLIKGHNAFTMYYVENGYSFWFGPLNSLEPGQGYVYYSNSGEAKTLTFNTVGGRTVQPNMTADDNLFRPEAGNYADNMTVTAVIELDDVELQGESYEVAAFTNGECRGSARLMYVAPLNRYMVFLTIAGDEASELHFGLYDAQTGNVETCHGASLQYETNAIVGDLETPYVISFRSTTGIDELGSRINVFPNPVARGENVTIGLPAVETLRATSVEIINALGQVVETASPSAQTIAAPKVAGVYTLRITVAGEGTYCRKLVVR